MRPAHEATLMMQPSFCAHCWEDGTHAVQKSIQIDVDDLVPSFQLHILPTAFREVQAGTVNEKIDSPILCENSARDSGDLVGVGDVERKHVDRAPARANFLCRGGQSVRTPARYDHSPSISSQGLGPRLADSAGTSSRPRYSLRSTTHAFRSFG